MATTSRALWTYGEKWQDFRPLLLGESLGPASFVSVNRSLYVVNATERWFRRATAVGWNTWSSDGSKRELRHIETASPCGLRMQWGRAAFGEFVSTTAIIAVFAGEVAELDNDALPDVSFDQWLCPTGHPQAHCGAMNCTHGRVVRIVLVDPRAVDEATDV
jgi:hypothetical protein